jgi:D-alanyl-D-alanine carboxypeptidase (penicillin-binding protein 5/6)
LAVVAAVLVAAVLVGALRVFVPLAQPTHVSLVRSSVVVGVTPGLPWPPTGQAAVSVPSLGYTAQSGGETPVPIASLTKMTTALVVLRDHPVAPGAPGPSITITAADAAQYGVDLSNDESNVPIQAGEVLTERQMLEALLTQSANDIAWSLAVWDAGSLPAFVAKMNSTAASLGAVSSHYVDASGYEPASQSTAADCLRIAAAAMGIPTFAEVVGMPMVTLPLVGTVHNIVTEVGTNNVIGIKSGFTSAAQACMVLAAERVIDGRPVLVLAAVTAQPTPAASGTTPTPYGPNGPDAFHYARPVINTLLEATAAGVVQTTVASPGQTAAVLTATWGGVAHRVRVVTTTGAWLTGWPGQRVAATAAIGSVPPGSSPGHPVGDALYTLGAQVERVPLALTSAVPEPTWWWRLVHG